MSAMDDTGRGLGDLGLRRESGRRSLVLIRHLLQLRLVDVVLGDPGTGMLRCERQKY